MDKKQPASPIIELPPSRDILLPGNIHLISDIVTQSDGALPGLAQPRGGGIAPLGIPLLPADQVVPRDMRFGRYRRIASRLPTYLADAVENPSWLLMFALGRFTPIRRVYRRRHPRARLAVHGDTLFQGIDLRETLARLEDDGLAPNFALPKPVVDEVHDFTKRTPCFGNFDRRMAFYPDDHATAEARYARPLLTGQYFDSVERCDAVTRIRRDPALQAVASAYLGPQAKPSATRLWWSFPTRPHESDLHLASQDRFHFDLDDWQTLKFFFYLTAVDQSAGPHVFMRGSHRAHALRHQLTLLVGHPIAAVVTAYGADNLAVITGDRGFSFAEDPFGFHMGISPRRAARLMLEVAFGVSDFSRRRFYGEPIIVK